MGGDDRSEHGDAERAAELAVVSFVAEPMPARSGGTDVMIIAVNGLIVTDMPAIIGTSGK